MTNPFTSFPIPTSDFGLHVNVRDFGAVGNDVTDDLPAFNAALSYLKANAPISGGSPVRLFIPPGKYFLSGPLNVHTPCVIYGVGGAQSILPGSGLRFAPRVWGIVLHEHRTTDDGGGLASGSSGLGDASGSEVRDLVIYGGGAQSFNGPFTNPANTNSASVGIWIRGTFCRVRDCTIAFFRGSGVLNGTTAGSTGATAGNGNNFAIERVSVYYCGGDGFEIFGSDSNAGKITACSAISCGATGFREYSFLGNTYDMCHARDCGIGDPTATGAPVAVCWNGVTNYFVMAGQEVAASTTVPGTNSAVWGGGYNIQGAASPTWAPGMTWATGGPYVTNPGNVNARNVFTGCYAELAQPPIQSTYPSLWVGGSIDDGPGFIGSGVYIGASQNGLRITGGLDLSAPIGGPGASMSFGLNGGTEIIRTGSGGANFATGFGLSGLTGGQNTIGTLHNNSFMSESWGLSNDATVYGPYHHFIRRLIIGQIDGSLADGKVLGTLGGGLAGINGQTVRVGDTFLRAGSPSGYNIGWWCTTAGVVGTSAVLTPFGNVLGAVPFASLDPSPTRGQIAAVSNCSTQVWGANADGAGALYVLVSWNGTNWTVIGK